MRRSQRAEDKIERNTYLHFHTNIFLNSSLYISTWFIIIRINVIFLTILKQQRKTLLVVIIQESQLTQTHALPEVHLYRCSLIIITGQICIPPPLFFLRGTLA